MCAPAACRLQDSQEETLAPITCSPLTLVLNCEDLAFVIYCSPSLCYLGMTENGLKHPEIILHQRRTRESWGSVMFTVTHHPSPLPDFFEVLISVVASDSFFQPQNKNTASFSDNWELISPLGRLELLKVLLRGYDVQTAAR